MPLTAGEIILARKKSDDPVGESFGVDMNIENTQQVDTVVAVLPSGRLVLDRFIKTTVGKQTLREKIGRRVIHPDDDTVVFR